MRIGRMVGVGVAVMAVMAALPGGPMTTADAQGPVTFSEHVAPILFDNCISCHRPGEAAPFSLMSYRDARPLARAIAGVTATRVMPPWKVSAGDHAFANERRLTDGEIATIERWVADGAVEGDPSRLPALPHFTEGWQLGPPDLVVSMATSFDVPASGPDVYRNFVLPLNLDRDTWVRAVDFRPSDRTVVHHSLFFLDATGTARAQDARDPLPGFPGGMGGGRGSAADAVGAAVVGRGCRPCSGVAAPRTRKRERAAGLAAGPSADGRSSCRRASRSSYPRGPT